MSVSKFTFTLITAAVLLYCIDCRCAEPKDVGEIKKSLHKTIKENYLSYMSFFNLHSNISWLTAQLKNPNVTAPHGDKAKAETKESVFVTRLYGDSKCDKRHRFRSSVSSTVNEASSCPWHYILEVDENRTPTSIMKARCSCKHCLVSTKRRSKRRSKARRNTCTELKFFMPVIRKTCESETYRYWIDIEQIPVGCTCQRTRRNKKENLTKT